MWLEQLALLYNQALHNSLFSPATDESRMRWVRRYEKLFPILDAEMQAVKGRACWVNGYAIVYPDITTKTDAAVEGSKIMKG